MGAGKLAPFQLASLCASDRNATINLNIDEPDQSCLNAEAGVSAWTAAQGKALDDCKRRICRS
jgi:hypothetical protein